jgi:ABC-type sugar transport system ATPase subunit
MQSRTVTLEAEGITKVFGAQVALRGVDVSLESGSIHGITGENGAGKSTLINILGGILQPDSGSLSLSGERVRFRDAEDARRKGILVVHQEPMIFRDLTVGENLILGNGDWRSRYCSYKSIEAYARRMLADLGIDLDPGRDGSGLSAGEGQLVELARAVNRGARVVILDEPTSALSTTESGMVLDTTRALAGRGVAVVFVSHRISEVFRVADTITVLRDGTKLCTEGASELTPRDVVSLMLGRPPTEADEGSREDRAGGPVLSGKGVSTLGGVHDASFEIREGEIVGFAGLRGAGQVSLVEAMVGVQKMSRGTLELRGKRIGPRSPAEARHIGLAYLAEDRQREGLFPWFSVANNISVGVLQRAKWWSRLRAAWEYGLAKEWSERLDIRPRDVDRPVDALSGGNQQKVLLARCLAESPVVLTLNNPGRGVDVGAKEQIYEIVRGLRGRDLAVIVVSEDLEELAALCDRLYLFHQGEVTGQLAAPVSPEDIALAIS